MKLWLFRRQTKKACYDEYYGAVVRAETIEKAGILFPYFKADNEEWTVQEITAEGEPEVILEDFHAG